MTDHNWINWDLALISLSSNIAQNSKGVCFLTTLIKKKKIVSFQEWWGKKEET